MNISEKYIKRCIELARNGLGSTYPNPMVGSVIVHDGKIIGEGWHRKAGEAHAEVNAINSVKDEKLLQDSTIYVSLEPCSHYGKTPPCSDLIIDKGIKKVVIGTMDPFAKVAGRGIKKLLDAGCKVKVGVLEEECLELNKRFFTFHKKRRSYIILKWAQTQDGFIAPQTKAENKPVWITNKYSGILVHKWRSEETAILVGTKTVLEDNPNLNVRKWNGEDPVRLIIDKDLKIPRETSVYNREQKTIIICSKKPENQNRDNLIFEEIDFSDNIATEICDILYKHELQSVIIEGGSKTTQQFIDSNLWDEARIFTGTTRFKTGVKAPLLNGNLENELLIANDNLKIYRNDQGDNL
ncbi:bifunctional diaminohydroxyphosphoribosylaminopyrimidine deaminase/5-amino-6-(5-phosphoribosylamino)uracil reductase RibD [Gramella sp. KN1008]|uniref:bifunctional diaminohydroxyphosphoribosylaminopyrimidine deaminase/5-amino-6-(5-phosphoribosylamino)uracil reductase RibD n=1 Tax=Gramella sp. KN1008 TaxID=2529298 RepID=UPI00103E1740|nr:bifunctional diaminohydroxyphosphoribosylaminopyrimidine deaminase/5-amino-6-(5-phosphoribosylamino)uracil reductase RibD [Gramella sp. KN1008]TBW26814.1 bifunctional diaminohydroxyphosphoribosylaminopyrimidine deaminase/5-amino-6-(5-phosphoribosylamino)uracil reductase RibD [Gramella sp. KN1008]